MRSAYVFLGKPEDFARVASPKMMSDFKMLRMNVCDVGRHAGTHRHKKGLIFIRVRGTVCDPDRQAENRDKNKG